MINRIDDTIAQFIGYVWVIVLASWGGAVSYFHKIDKHNIRFSLLRFFAEVSTSAFVGVVTFLICDSAKLSWEVTAAFVGVSGHMGTRALFLIEKKYEDFVNGGVGNGSK